ncbi:tellurite methyltransferase [Caedimonas varicaedens]|uniref:Tellurite methyltransferase n=1 Tax=Caedimonas varicaedens TaxID=1629334 RepID=A0A0K8MFT3_9PROT|nr:tellurite methyltransferase [Caedimonas varicaedens]
MQGSHRLVNFLYSDKSSVPYYNQNAQIFYERTINADLSAGYNRFLALLEPPAKILDVGCGVGRDARYFEGLGYHVTAFDGSEEMVKFANQLLKEPAKLMFFEDMEFNNEFDGVWAAASLIHVPDNELPGILHRIHRALKPGGIFFATFKHGEGSHMQDGRTFYYMTEEPIRRYLGDQFEVIDIWTTEDLSSKVAHSPNKMWLNVLARKN